MYNKSMEKPSILHVARKIVELMQDKGLTPLKLQKLAYYCQAWSLVWEGRPMFDEEFEAWANGPVNTRLYSKHKGTFGIGNDFLTQYSGFKFDEQDLHTIESVLAFYGNKEPFYLSELTHQERPWKEARGNTPLGASCDNVIEKDIMQDYYAGISS